MTAAAANTKPFAPFEWMLALRYLRARRKEGFISVIAGFSFTGIMLGVATLIIVMAVMNGFRNQLYEKILGLNGHAVVQRLHGTGPFNEFNEIAAKLVAVPGVKSAIPLIEIRTTDAIDISISPTLGILSSTVRLGKLA